MSIVTLIYAMLLFPEAQTRVAAEMNDVVGRDRVPTLANLPNRPDLNPTWRECLRWRPPLPLCESTVTVPGISVLMGLTAAFDVAIPHKSTEEDVYNGYRIPKGSIIYSNVAYVLVFPAPARRGVTLIATRFGRSCSLIFLHSDFSRPLTYNTM